MGNSQRKLKISAPEGKVRVPQTVAEAPVCPKKSHMESKSVTQQAPELQATGTTFPTLGLDPCGWQPGWGTPFIPQFTPPGPSNTVDVPDRLSGMPWCPFLQFLWALTMGAPHSWEALLRDRGDT